MQRGKIKESDYRKNVGMVLVSDEHKILIGEASFYPGEWMMPQGGMEQDETEEETLWRELQEETGITRDQATIVNRYPDWLYYPLRKPLHQQGHVFLGQKQKWFLLSYNGPIPDTHDIDKNEFLRFNRSSPEWLLERTPEVKLPVYKTLFSYFHLV